MRRALAGPVADARVRAALEAVAGFAAQAEQLARATDVHRREIRALDEHIYGGVIDLRVGAAHDTRERDAFGLIGDEQHFIRQRAFLIVERFEFFAFFC